MSDDIFTKLDKAAAQFDAGNAAGWMTCLHKLRAKGYKIEVNNHVVWVINGCIMWVPLDDTKEL